MAHGRRHWRLASQAGRHLGQAYPLQLLLLVVGEVVVVVVVVDPPWLPAAHAQCGWHGKQWMP